MQRPSTEWFTHARFGMFIHWGLYAIPALGDPWYRSQQRATIQDYQQYFDSFNPVEYDPAAWARAAKNAGMKYMVLTAKHHDGFCLFDSRHTDYKSTNTPAGRDLVRQFVQAVRAEGLGVGLYYSLLDWHHPHYPKFNDPFHPDRGRQELQGEQICFERYLNYMHAQVEELVTGYGRLDIMWFDFSYGELRGEAWQATRLMNMVRRHQPHILIDNRLEADGASLGSMAGPEPSAYSGDFACPEHHLPYKGLTRPDGSPLPWELCTTMNNNWGYAPADRDYKPADMLVHKLVECVSKNGNLLLNVGPDPLGRIPRPALERLGEIGQWMESNQESVCGCGAAGLPRPDWGRYTRALNGKAIYAHLFEAPIGPIELVGIDPGRIKSVSLLCDGRQARFADEAFAARHRRDVRFVGLGPDPNFSYPLPQPVDTVLKINLAD